MKIIKSLSIFLAISTLLAVAPSQAMEKEKNYENAFIYGHEKIEIPTLFELATLALLELYALDNKLLDSNNHIQLLLGNGTEIGTYQLPAVLKNKIGKIVESYCLPMLQPLLPKSYRPRASNQILMLQEEIDRQNLTAVGAFFNRSSLPAILALLTAQKQRNNKEPINQKLFDLIEKEGTPRLQTLAKELAAGEYDYIFCGKSVLTVPRRGNNDNPHKTNCIIS